MSALLPLVVLLPLAGAALAVASARASAAIALITAGAVATVTALIADRVITGGPLVHRAGAWGAPFGIDLLADGLSVLLLAVAAIVGGAITLHASAYFRPIEAEDDDRGVRFFWPLWLLLWAALNTIFISTDLFNIYVALELLSLPAVALTALDGSRDAVAAAMRYLLISLAGSLAFLLGVAIVYAGAGTLSIELLAESGIAPQARRVALALMTLGLAAKIALFPLHGWLPPAHTHAPAPASALLSGLVVKAGFVVLLRLWMQAFPGAAAGAAVVLLGALGAAAVLWGSLLALRQSRVKLIVAYSTVAQLGYLFLIFPLFAAAPADAWVGGLYHLLSHALAKAAMFLAAGSMIRALGDDRLDTLAGVGQKLPLTFAAFGIAGLNLAGMPPSGGFIGKWLLLSAALSTGQWWWVVTIAAGSLLAAGYVFLVLRAAFLMPQERPLRDQPNWRITTAALGLALLAMTLGIFAETPLRIIGATVPLPVPAPQ
jgi:multicomponent Na+:H+ antiporter subunit D